MNLSRSLLTFAASLLSLAPAYAHADVAPPDGSRYVEYRFRVDGVSKLSPDHVIVVYPWSTSNGVPTREHTIAVEGQFVRVGRRSDTPVLYAVRKADYDAFAKTYVQPENFSPDPAMDAFVAKAAKCNLAPSPAFELPSSDPRSAIEDIFVAQTITDTSCVLAKENPPAGNSPASLDTAPKSGGCAGCTIGDAQVASGVSLAGLLIGLVALQKRRRRP